MIYNGFQARILDVHHEPLAEMMPEVMKDKTRMNENDEIQLAEQNQTDLEEFQHALGQQAVQNYHSSLRHDALKNVRCGAVRVRVDEQDEMVNEEIKKIDEKKIQFNLLNQQQTISTISTTKRSNHLFLAFRWVGTDHRNATRAHELDELQNVFFPILYAHGLPTSTILPDRNGKSQIGGQENEKDLKLSKKIVRFLSVKSKIKEKSAVMNKVSLIKDPSLISSNQRKTFSLRARKNAISSHPFLMQLYIDGHPVPIRKDPWTEEKDASQGAMIVWMSDGALIDLGRLDMDLNDFNKTGTGNKQVRSITLHLWDGMRKELWNNSVTFTMKGDSGLVYPTCDIKQISSPNAILHFNVVAFKNTNISIDEENVPTPTQQTATKEFLRPLTTEDTSMSRLAVVNECSEENIVSDNKTSEATSTIEESLIEPEQKDVPEKVSEETLKGKAAEVSVAIADSTNSIETDVRKGEFQRNRVSSLQQQRARTTSLQASVLQPSIDEVYSPIRAMFEEVDRLRFEHEQLKSSMKHLDGQWRDQIVTELHRLRGEIRERIDFDKDHYEKVRRRFSLPQQPDNDIHRE